MSEGSSQKNVRAECAAWHERLYADDASEEDWLAFERWMESPSNRAAYEAFESTIAVIADNRAAISDALKLSTPPVRKHVPTMIWATAAAGLAAVWFGLVVLAPQNAQVTTYAAPATGPRIVTLADNSVVQLNRDALVRVRFDAQSRQIVLERGEASFAVVHDAARPFAVIAGEVTIRDIGTEFDVVRAAGYVTVTVRAGQVALMHAGGRGVNVGVGQQGRIDRGRSEATVSPANPDDAFSWQSGRLVYRDAPRSRVVEDINRYSEIPVVIADASAAGLHFSGSLVIDKPVEMVRRLEAFLPIRSAQDAGRIVIRSRP